MKTFAVGDIHGAHRALVQVLERAGFDYDKHRLISLGDVADGWPETFECVEELLKMKHLVCIRGNHDWWTMRYFATGEIEGRWYTYGGKETLASYKKRSKKELKKHSTFFREQENYFVRKGKLFVHGGYDWTKKLQKQDSFKFPWDRELWRTAIEKHGAGKKLTNKDKFDEIFIGHTNTYSSFPDLKPVNRCNVWNLDQGVRAGGKLTLMNVKTKEYWQSDLVKKLY